jgi:hypothetical protein
MKIIRPITITTAMLPDGSGGSNVPETVAAYAAGTTYYGGDQVRVDSSHKIYESLPPTAREILTLDVAPSTPWLPDWKITGQTSLQTCIIEQYITSLTYYIKDRSGAFTLGEIVGVTGTAVLLADQGAANPVFSSAPNVGNDPATDLALDTPLWWKEVSATNRWKAFDNKVGSQTSQATSITYCITPGQVYDSIAFLNLDAITVQVVLTDPVEGVVYDHTTDLQTTVISGAGTTIDWYTYFFSSIFRTTDIAILDIPPYLNAVVDVTITYTGETAKVGAIVLGLQSTIGTTRWNPNIGIHDYSIKAVDEYGVYSVSERAFSKRMSCDIEIEFASIPDVQNLLALYRSTLLVWIGVENFSPLIVYGFYKDFSIVIPHLVYAECNIEIEGLT